MDPKPDELHEFHMRQAIELAWRGEGYVEPNPLVGCVLARDAEVVGMGWHRRFGGPHAEVDALAVAGAKARGATMYVTLEPCCHHGKTPPCTDAIISAGVKQVVIACTDPNPKVAGKGVRKLESEGIPCVTRVCADVAERQLAPYVMLTQNARPWVIAKWAMTADGKIATRTGDSRWISSPASRALVHQLRARVDAILVGRRTVVADDPRLTARVSEAGFSAGDGPANWPPKRATRLVLDSELKIGLKSQLVSTIDDAPLIVVAGSQADESKAIQLQNAGCEILRIEAESRAQQIGEILHELGRRQMTNVLVEGGSEVLGSFFKSGLIDEVWGFVGAKLIGGHNAPGPIGGNGIALIQDALSLESIDWRNVDDDLWLRGYISKDGAR